MSNLTGEKEAEQTTVDKAKAKLKQWFSWEKIVDNLPLIVGVGVGLYVLDRVVGISEKIKPMMDKIDMNESEFLEAVDTVGDNLQLVEKILDQFGYKVELKKIADFLQNTSQAGKYITKLFGVFKGKFGKGRHGGSGRYS